MQKIDVRLGKLISLGFANEPVDGERERMNFRYVEPNSAREALNPIQLD